jgi:hypothetical protein
MLDAGTIKAVAFSAAGGRSAVCEMNLKKIEGLVRRSGARLQIAGCDSEQKPGEGPAVNAIDGKSSTFWHTRWEPKAMPYPHFLAVDLGESVKIGGITFQGRSDGNANGCIKKYRVYVSQDGKTWGPALAEGEFKMPQSAEQRVEFGKTATGRYVKLEALSEVENRPFAAVAEIGVLVAL